MWLSLFVCYIFINICKLWTHKQRNTDRCVVWHAYVKYCPLIFALIVRLLFWREEKMKELLHPVWTRIKKQLNLLYFPKCTGDLHFLRYFYGLFFFLKDEHILQDHQWLHLNTAWQGRLTQTGFIPLVEQICVLGTIIRTWQQVGLVPPDSS